MAGRTALTPKALKTPYSDVSANDLDFAFAAADQANGNAFPFSGREIILLQNSGVSPATVTLASAPDTYGRTKDIATYSLSAGEFAAFWAGAITSPSTVTSTGPPPGRSVVTRILPETWPGTFVAVNVIGTTW